VKRLVAFAVVAGMLVFLPATPVLAHPLGNFTVNQYSGLRVQSDRVLVDLVIDEAEIPAFQARDDLDANDDGTIDEAEGATYRARTCEGLQERLHLLLDGHPQPLRVGASTLAFPPGQAGLSTLRLTCSLTAETGRLSGDHELTYRNANLEDRVGWREITAEGDGTTLVASDVPQASASARLTSYPDDLLQSPLDQRGATLRFRPGGPRVGGSAPADPTSIMPRGLDRATRAFTALVSRRDLSVGLGLLAMLVAVVLGAAHGLAPGHGKTVMAAFVVGQRGSLRQVGLICLTVAATHTAGVLALGVLLSTSAAIAPDRLYPWLGLASGVLVVTIGVGLLNSALRRRLTWAGGGESGDRDHHHDDHRGRDHGAHDHGGHVHTHHGAGGWPGSRRGLVAVGFAGGLVPSPSALVVLLGAIALGRSWFGLVLVVAYGAGMAAMLGTAGLLLVRARDILDRWSGRPRATALVGALPVVTASLIVMVGLALAVRGVAAL
jgi:ABC-type nickel/cobalt efflux system permease component RcnA